MFTGIIKALGTITDMTHEGSNIHVTVESELANDVSVDQSVAHDGVCLTITSASAKTHVVTAIQETLDRSTLAEWKVGREVNLELAMQAGARLDGHMVQGHVDTTAECISVEDVDGSWNYRFKYEVHPERILVDKGSICINGVSLTVNDPTIDTFGVSIIPYTYEHTTFKNLKPGSKINLEFDVIGKYVVRYARLYGKEA
ncbi:MAG: riboflavin synthase [Saprospiraceae bacterium]